MLKTATASELSEEQALVAQYEWPPRLAEYTLGLHDPDHYPPLSIALTADAFVDLPAPPEKKALSIR